VAASYFNTASYSATVALKTSILPYSVVIADSLALTKSASNSSNKFLTLAKSSGLKSPPKVSKRVKGAAIIDPLPA
jgi:hypothetical protein